jgi:hypothetical protein
LPTVAVENVFLNRDYSFTFQIQEQKMNSNYHFQKHQANEQIQARLQEAEDHRLSKQANGDSSLSLLVLLAIPLLVGISVAFFLLTG